MILIFVFAITNAFAMYNCDFVNPWTQSQAGHYAGFEWAKGVDADSCPSIGAHGRSFSEGCDEYIRQKTVCKQKL